MIEQDAQAPEKLWRQWLDARFDREVKRGYDLGGVEWSSSPDDVREQAVGFARTYIENIAPRYKAIAVEDMFVATVAGVAVPIVGFIDLVTESLLVDQKFGRLHSSLDPEWRVQGLVYLLASDKDVAFHSIGKARKDCIPASTMMSL